MSNKHSNYPQGELSQKFNGNEQTGQLINCIMDLSDKGKPETVEELEERINDYFTFCGMNNFRPGIESLALSLGVSRVSFWKWCYEGSGKPKQWVDICKTAKQMIIAFTEQAALSGKLNPATSIFLMKNLGGYKDSISFEEITPQDNIHNFAVEYPKLGNDDDDIPTKTIPLKASVSEYPKLNGM